MGRIEASIVPIVNSEGSDRDKESSPETLSKAEVRVLVSKDPGPVRNSLIRPPDPHEEGLIRASSILMEYDEDTRKYIQPNARIPIPEHRIRHSLHKHIAPEPLLDDYFAANDAPLDEVDSSSSSSPPTEELVKTKDEILDSSEARDNPTRIVLHVNSFSPAPRRSYSARKVQREDALGKAIPNSIASTSTFKPLNRDSVIAFRSPVRIYIPVRYDADRSSSDHDSDGNCVQCPENITLSTPRGETHAEAPVPAISVCHGLARLRRPINVAITAGPRPGIRIPGGSYQIELAVWVADQIVHSCQYTLDVIVKKCKDVFPPSEGSVHCSHGTIWGSQCNFSCSAGYELLGHHSVICEEHSNGMSWSSSFPKCKKIPYKYSPSVKSLPCLKPQQPNDGTVVCDSNGQSRYPDGSVCQFFCYPGFLIENLMTSNALIVCKNGQWTPNSNVQCIATYCSDPKQPKYGSVKCNDKDVKEASFKSKYKNGTFCHYHCDTGYVIPKSQRHLNKITCHAPHWNDSSIPECKQKFVPRPFSQDCKDITLIANRRGFAKLKPPRFYMKTASKNHILYGNCSYTGRINVGSYINHCSAYNKELNTTGHCTFRITVKENSCPPPPIVSHSKLHCEHGGTHSFPKGSICKYICNSGFVMPLRERKFQSIKCTSKRHWKPAAVPHCKRSVPPKPRKNSCISQTILAKDGTSGKIKLPKFKSSMKGSKIKVKCSLHGTLPVGHYTNHCEAVDKQLGISSTCSYNITIQGSGCRELPVTSFLLANCSSSKSAEYFPVGTICIYSCEEGYIFSSSSLLNSFKMCIAHEEWNNPLMPACINQSPPVLVDDLDQSPLIPADGLDQTPPVLVDDFDRSSPVPVDDLDHSTPIFVDLDQAPPVPVDDSCINRSTVIEDISTFQIPIPKFKSSSGKVEVNCKPQNISQFGIYSINCTAIDLESRTESHCIFELEILKVNGITEPPKEGCPQLPIIPSGSLTCTSSKDGDFYPIGTECKYNCDDGYVFPTSALEHAEKYCIGHEKWRSTVSPVCTYLAPPVAEVDSCLDYSITVEDLATFQYNVPQFISANGATIKAECKPSTITEYAEQNITCSAYDPELRVLGSCSFMLDVQIPNNVAALSAEEISCSYPEKIQNGDIQCNSTISKLYSVGTICRIECNNGFTLPLSKLNLSVSECLSNGEWNVSSNPFCLKSEPPILVSGCENSTVYTSDLPLLNISLPIFSSQNTSVNVTCLPETFEDYGEYEVLCTAHNLELDISTKCKFHLNLLNNQTKITSTEEYSEIFSTTDRPYEACKPVQPPHKGSISCSYEPPVYCNISCDDGYEFSSEYELLNSERLECDGTDGLWIYEKTYGTHLLPECLGRLQNTFVEVEVTFNAYVERCDGTYESELQSSILDLLIAMNQQMCQSVNCSFFNVSCYMDSSSKRFKINNTWILKASYDPSDYINSDEMPDAETHIETILDVTQKEIKSKNSKFKEDLLGMGVELLLDTHPDSYQQSHFFLVCEKDGYAVDLKTNKCVECPSGTMEKNGTCVPCPTGFYQLSTGQSSCEVCPDSSVWTSDIPKTCSGNLPRFRDFEQPDIEIGTRVQ